MQVLNVLNASVVVIPASKNPGLYDFVVLRFNVCTTVYARLVLFIHYLFHIDKSLYLLALSQLICHICFATYICFIVLICRSLLLLICRVSAMKEVISLKMLNYYSK
jgi:hypothetical protein